MEDYKKKYETAINQAKEELKACGDLNCDAARQIFRFFPELKESEDEKMRNFISHELACLRATDENGSDRYEELTNAIAWLEKQGEQKYICQLDNSYACVKFPFKAKVKSSGAIVTIYDGQLSHDGKKWIKYQSDRKDGYKVYEPDSLELVCEIEQKPTWSEEDEKLYTWCASAIQTRYNDGLFTMDEYSETSLWLKSLKERLKGE